MKSESRSRLRGAFNAGPSHSTLFLYEIVTGTVLILGASQFAREGNTTLIYIACGMATAHAGQPIMRNMPQLLRVKFLPGDIKKVSGKTRDVPLSQTVNITRFADAIPDFV